MWLKLKNWVGSSTITVMIKNTALNEQGETNPLLLPTVLLAVFFIAAASFAVWAFGSRQDYKNNVDAKITAAVDANKQVVQAADSKQYAEASKNPLKTYIGPDAYGAVHISYPKTWSAYIDTTNSSTPLNAYFHSDYVPAINDNNASFNLQVQIVATSYDSIVSQFTDQIQQGAGTATPYKLAKVPSVVGTRFDGKIFDDQNASGSIVVLPIRDKTLEVSVQSNTYLADFNNYILPNLSFSP